MRRILHESGGIWLIGCGAPQGALNETLRALQTKYQNNSVLNNSIQNNSIQNNSVPNSSMLNNSIQNNFMPNNSVTVLIYPSQQKEASLADEVWVLGRGGFTGLLALIRRAAWRHFDIVIEPWKQAVPWLKYLIWPRPKWQYGIDLP
ncbi:MAG: hypothetical protein OXT03_04670 [Alphaproteobacteria bacterium]|nr:hypothetical protein [Alphaproteobacteria bacterium]